MISMFGYMNLCMTMPLTKKSKDFAPLDIVSRTGLLCFTGFNAVVLGHTIYYLI